MKKILYSLIAALPLISCKGFLETTPQDFNDPKNWYNTREELESSLASVYNYLRDSYTDNLSVWFPMANDLYFDRSSTASGDKVQFFTNSPSTTTAYNVWTQLYKGIDNANLFLENADNGIEKAGAEMVGYMKGEALFLKAYYHFLLTAYWGDVPYRSHSTGAVADGYKGVTPQAEIFEMVIDDLEQSIAMLPEISHYGIGGRASKSAAKGMLARVCLHAAGRLGEPSYYALSAQWASDLIDDEIHQLNPSFEDVFVKLMKDEYDVKESIFEVEAWGNVHTAQYQETGMWSAYFSPQFGGIGDLQIIPMKDSPLYIARGRNQIVSTPYFFSLYESGDLRRGWTLATQLYNSNTNPAEFTDYFPEFVFRYPGKYRRIYETSPVYSWGNSTNLPLLRYSDVLLMYAEAQSKADGAPSAEAVEAVNKVRRRGYGLPVNIPASAVDIASMSGEDFEVVIREERARELAFESHRKLDLIRWGILKSQLNAVGAQIDALQVDIPNPGGSGTIKNPVCVQGGSGVSQVMSELSVAFRNVDTRHNLMPIPQREMDTNTEIETNNPGW